MVDATQLRFFCPWRHARCYASDGVVGWGWVKFLHIERKITNVVHSHPPSHYIRRHAKLNAFASTLPHCAVRMLRTISLHFFRAPLNGCRFWDGPIVFQRLPRFTTSKAPTSILWFATFDIPTFWCDMRFEEL